MDPKLIERALDEALEMTFPASDPIALSLEADEHEDEEDA
jgi:hypothetical protein